MKLFRTLICISCMSAGCFLLAQQAPTQPQGGNASPQAATPNSGDAKQASNSLKISPGSVIPVQLTKSIDAKRVKAGDEIDAKVTQDLKSVNGEVVVPKDTKVVGHVTEAQARNKEQKESQLGIAFDHAVMKSGGDVTLPMSIQAIISQASLNGGGSSAPPSNNGSPAPAPSNAGSSPMNGGGRPTGMAGTTPPPVPSPAATGGDAPQTGAVTHEPITGNTQGVVGLGDLKLSAATGATQGSVVSSEKNNVKLESGTLLLLRVNQ